MSNQWSWYYSIPFAVSFIFRISQGCCSLFIFACLTCLTTAERCADHPCSITAAYFWSTGHRWQTRASNKFQDIVRCWLCCRREHGRLQWVTCIILDPSIVCWAHDWRVLKSHLPGAAHIVSPFYVFLEGFVCWGKRAKFGHTCGNSPASFQHPNFDSWSCHGGSIMYAITCWYECSDCCNPWDKVWPKWCPEGVQQWL